MNETNLEPFEAHVSDSEKYKQVEIEVIDEIPPPKFNPPLIVPFNPLLIQVNIPFGDHVSYFNNPHKNSCINGSSSMGKRIPTLSSTT